MCDQTTRPHGMLRLVPAASCSRLPRAVARSVPPSSCPPSHVARRAVTVVRHVESCRARLSGGERAEQAARHSAGCRRRSPLRSHTPQFKLPAPPLPPSPPPAPAPPSPPRPRCPPPPPAAHRTPPPPASPGCKPQTCRRPASPAWVGGAQQRAGGAGPARLAAPGKAAGWPQVASRAPPPPPPACHAATYRVEAGAGVKLKCGGERAVCQHQRVGHGVGVQRVVQLPVNGLHRRGRGAARDTMRQRRAAPAATWHHATHSSPPLPLPHLVLERYRAQVALLQYRGAHMLKQRRLVARRRRQDGQPTHPRLQVVPEQHQLPAAVPYPAGQSEAERAGSTGGTVLPKQPGAASVARRCGAAAPPLLSAPAGVAGQHRIGHRLCQRRRHRAWQPRPRQAAARPQVVWAWHQHKLAAGLQAGAGAAEGKRCAAGVSAWHVPSLPRRALAATPACHPP